MQKREGVRQTGVGGRGEGGVVRLVVVDVMA